MLKSPVVALLNESLHARAVIAAFQAQSFFLRQHEDALYRITSAEMTSNSLHTWVNTRTELLSAAIVLACGCLYVFGVLSSVHAGLALSVATTLTESFSILLWALVEMEVDMNSVQRLKHDIEDLPQEEEDDADPKHIGLPESWPEDARIEFERVSLRYRTRGKPALDQVSLTVTPRERVGIVGHAGKPQTCRPPEVNGFLCHTNK